MQRVALAIVGFLVPFAAAWDYAPNAHLRLPSHHFASNTTEDHLRLLGGGGSVLLGGRNVIYNVTVAKDGQLTVAGSVSWASTDAHRELCTLKGKQEDDCQNYIRIYAQVSPQQAMICGTNSYKPLCRYYSTPLDGEGDGVSEEAQGRCPYSPTHSSTYAFTDGQLFSGTVADFSGSDPLIYREHQRTEQYDLKQLNQPAFVSATAYDAYVFFVFRETAMEHMNCGKAVFSRIGRVCRGDRGGPGGFLDRWTSFLKARLNCSLPGDYPFYFDHVVATTDVVKINEEDVMYGVFTTPPNAIEGSAVCSFRMSDILEAFEGPFKAQKDSRSNWLPVPAGVTPIDPRPGTCVDDSRTLPSATVNFVKTHPLMDRAVPSQKGRPVLVTTGAKMLLTSVTTVETLGVDGLSYNMLYAGTAHGRLVKFYTTPEGATVVVWEAQVLPPGKRVVQLRAVEHHLVVVSENAVVSVPQAHCGNWTSCSSCVEARDPHCGWHEETRSCRSHGRLVHALGTLHAVCPEENWVEERVVTRGTVSSVGRDPQSGFLATERNTTCPEVTLAASYSAHTMAVALVAVAAVALAVGGLVGVVVGHKCRHECPLVGAGTPLEHRNQLTWSKSRHMAHSKDINLLMNTQHMYATPETPQPPRKLDNLDLVDLDKDRRHESKNSTESLEKDPHLFKTDTLKKVKKTYI
ncbi:semaphorin-1A [Phlebotomus argentipes]|uniref:semaphorin-1A n=1 Tax=Phlebotomus argentipes TaxID=94469 RepID=UPI0028930C23|nr:semaphorin-1A [Phlebotomus argentipes]